MIAKRMIDLLVSDRAMFYFGLIPNSHSGFADRIFNEHPAAIIGPNAFPGKEPVADAVAAFNSGLTQETSATFHRLTPKVDDGNIISVATVPMVAGDTEYTLTSRMYALREAMNEVDAIREIVSKGHILMRPYDPPKMEWANKVVDSPIDIESIYGAVKAPVRPLSTQTAVGCLHKTLMQIAP